MDKGFYRDAGLDVSLSPSTGSGFVLTALQGGKADFGIVEAAPVVQAVAKGARVKALGVFMDVSTSGLAALSPHPTRSRWRARPLAAALTDSARVILPVVFRNKGLDPARLKWLAVDPSVYFPLLLEGRVDVVTASVDGDVPALKRVAERAGKTVHFSAFAEWGYDVFGYFFVTRADVLQTSLEDVRAFAGRTAKAVKYAVDLPEARAGENVGLLLRGVKQEEVVRGQVVSLPGAVQPHTVGEADLYVLAAEEGGRHTAFGSGYSPQFFFGTTDVTGVIEVAAGESDGRVPPGGRSRVVFRLQRPVGLEAGMRFAIREGRRTVGAGRVTAVCA